MSWSDERVETLKRMWGEGQSASQIAKELGGVTRNAVIGKVHRLGLSNRNGGAGSAGASAASEAPASETPKPAPKPAAKPSKPAAKSASAHPAKADPAPAPEEDKAEEAPAAPVTRIKPIIPAGQPLPPQPSTNEIDPKALAKVSEVEKKAKKLSLMELTSRTCKWPVGDPATDDFWFCGLPSQAGKPYCEAHVGVAFQPMSSRRDRRR
ncbi:GcrA cell cycle regulator [Roseovarius nanhaiticus]|uniref:GcrA cell cycle regulator n=1 Tax=Roseovarius nanhaiticus TaxID=573024 RepID=A0A1N7FZQ7_9RHOB|nr:GcrA family cell cycle regulator [Roseovarius nanhaiticus]SEK40890.1 GcrA cell cycle regulator [Roseovarius nanhaiticus]SIS05840.1 GcrA cell cycle regulator [Roseovarius nanhaiticus]